MKTMYISPWQDDCPIGFVKMVVPEHFTEEQARAQYFQAEFDKWKAEPLETFPQKLPNGVAPFLNELKKMSDTNVIEIKSRRALARQLGFSFGRLTHYITALRKAEQVETRTFNNKTVRGYFLKY